MVLSQGAKLTRLFPIQRKGFMSMGASRQPTRSLVHSHSFFRSQWTLLSSSTPPGNTGATRLVVGDAANGDSILTWELGNLGNPDSCANGDLHTVSRGPLLAERAGTLALEAASPRTDA